MDYLITNSALVLGGVEDASVPGTFDPAFATHAIRFTEADDAAIALPPVNDVWLHADLYYDDFDTTSNGDGCMWSIAVPNAEIAVVDFDNGSRALDYNSGSSASASSTGPSMTGIPNAQRFTLDVHIETGAAVNGNVDGHRVTLYANGNMLGQVTGTAALVNGNPAISFSFGGTNFLDGNARFFVSNVLVSDQDTRGRRFRVLRPTGAGALATAVGGHSELGDANPATFAYARAAGEAVTSIITPGATPSGTIGRLILASHARNAVDAPNPSQVINRLRIGGADYDAAGLSPAGATIELLQSEWTVNPATGLPWAWDDLASLEIGFAGAT